MFNQPMSSQQTKITSHGPETTTQIYEKTCGARSTSRAGRAYDRDMRRSCETCYPLEMVDRMTYSPAHSEKLCLKPFFERQSSSSSSANSDSHETIGSIKLLQSLGCGNSSVVKLGRCKRGNLVAVKVIKNDLDQSTLQYAREEFSVMKTLEHEHVLRLISSGNAMHKVPGGKSCRTNYGVFEFAPSGELFDLVDIARGFNEPLARHYFA